MPISPPSPHHRFMDDAEDLPSVIPGLTRSAIALIPTSPSSADFSKASISSSLLIRRTAMNSLGDEDKFGLR